MLKCNLKDIISLPHPNKGRDAFMVKFVKKVILWPKSTHFWKNIEVDLKIF